MREFDHDGLLLAEYQGKLFEKSEEFSCSSAIFIRRFLYSDLLKSLDNNKSISFDINDGLQSIWEQFGDSSYGKEKYSKAVLFWIGYMYRYIAYTREQDTAYIMKMFDHKQMSDVYYSYHTQDPEWCIKSLLNLNGTTEDIFDKNIRLKNIIKEKGKY